MSNDDSQFDLVVFGATGFVGSILCQYLIDCVGTQGDVTWAAAGRSKAKLDKLVTTLGSKAIDLPLVTADVTDDASLRALCEQTRVIVSTVGPYALYGEPLVKVCAETGTDYCDLTGEPQWIRLMLETYGALAKQSGARIVHCCGFDSIPSDLGVYYLQRQAQQRFGQPCVQVKMRVKGAQGGVSGGTIASGVNAVKEVVANPSLRQELENPYSLCPEGDPAAHPPTQMPVQYDENFQSWIAPFVMADVNTRIVLRSNALLGYAYSPEFQYDEAILTDQELKGWMTAQAVKVGLVSFVLATAFQPTRWLLENWIRPKSGEGPSAEAQAQGYFDLRFWGKTAAGESIQVKVTGDRDPGYGSTAKMLGQAGICLAKDFPKSEKPGGFWTPSALFGEVLIERLVHYAGLTFEVL